MAVGAGVRSWLFLSSSKVVSPRLDAMTSRSSSISKTVPLRMERFCF